MWTQNVEELKQKTLKTFGAPFKNSHDILLAEGILISICEHKQNLKKLQKLELKTRPLVAKAAQYTSRRMFSGSCLEVLRPNKLNFTTALTWSEPENGPIRPENLSAGSHCHFSQSASVDFYNKRRTTDSCTVHGLDSATDRGIETAQIWVCCPLLFPITENFQVILNIIASQSSIRHNTQYC